eukprot:1261503-Pyramimonas_sp.AAC.1
MCARARPPCLMGMWVCSTALSSIQQGKWSEYPTAGERGSIARGPEPQWRRLERQRDRRGARGGAK